MSKRKREERSFYVYMTGEADMCRKKRKHNWKIQRGKGERCCIQFFLGPCSSTLRCERKEKSARARAMLLLSNCPFFTFECFFAASVAELDRALVPLDVHCTAPCPVVSLQLYIILFYRRSDESSPVLLRLLNDRERLLGDDTPLTWLSRWTRYNTVCGILREENATRIHAQYSSVDTVHLLWLRLRIEKKNKGQQLIIAFPGAWYSEFCVIYIYLSHLFLFQNSYLNKWRITFEWSCAACIVPPSTRLSAVCGLLRTNCWMFSGRRKMDKVIHTDVRTLYNLFNKTMCVISCVSLFKLRTRFRAFCIHVWLWCRFSWTISAETEEESVDVSVENLYTSCSHLRREITPFLSLFLTTVIPVSVNS